MIKKPTIAELENFMGDGYDVRITPNGKAIIDKKPAVHILEDILRISELEGMLKICADTFDMLDEHTHPNIECDAMASECRKVLQSPDVREQQIGDKK